MQIKITTDRPLTYGDIVEITTLGETHGIDLNFDMRVNVLNGTQTFTARANPVRLFRFFRGMRCTAIAGD